MIKIITITVYSLLIIVLTGSTDASNVIEDELKQLYCSSSTVPAQEVTSKSSRVKRDRTDKTDAKNLDITPPRKKKRKKRNHKIKKFPKNFYGKGLEATKLPELTAFFTEDDIKRNMQYFIKLMTKS